MADRHISDITVTKEIINDNDNNDEELLMYDFLNVCKGLEEFERRAL